jgi:hypothetical protein
LGLNGKKHSTFNIERPSASNSSTCGMLEGFGGQVLGEHRARLWDGTDGGEARGRRSEVRGHGDHGRHVGGTWPTTWKAGGGWTKPITDPRSDWERGLSQSAAGGQTIGLAKHDEFRSGGVRRVPPLLRYGAASGTTRAPTAPWFRNAWTGWDGPAICGVLRSGRVLRVETTRAPSFKAHTSQWADGKSGIARHQSNHPPIPP